MNKDEMLTFMVENGLLSVDWYYPPTYPARIKKSSKPKEKVDARIVAYHHGEMSESDLCNGLGIEESELFRYLVDNGALFL